MPQNARAEPASARPGLLFALAVALPALVVAPPLAAQVRNNDVRLTSALDVAYKIDPDWKLDVFGEGRLDHDVSRLRDLVLRPNVQYAFSPHWAAAVGYVQFQPFVSPIRPDRGSFEDVFYAVHFGSLGIVNRLRVNELFPDQSSAFLVTSSYLLALQHPIGDSAWFAVLSNEALFNLKVDGTPREAGFQEDKVYIGIGRPIDRHMTLTAGYELATDEIRGVIYNAHTIKFALALQLN